MSSDRCSVCDFARIPGLTSCANCGEPTAQAFNFQLEHTDDSDSNVDPVEYAKERDRGRNVSRRITEARALEYAGDTQTAIQLYEEMVAERFRFTPPYQRLAIIYARAKRPHDEERVVRAALACFGGGSSDWFVLRLAKILSKRRG